MSETKRYYWIKLSGDFFRDKLIKRLRKISGGDTFVIIYLKMLIRAAENDGKLYYEGVEDDFCSELALDIDEDAENVQITVNYLVKHGILVSDTQEEFVLVTVKEMAGKETDSARRTRKYRAKLSQSDALPSHSDTETETDPETDPDIEKKEERETAGPTLDEVKVFAEEIGAKLDPRVFFHKMEAFGWKVKGERVRDWRNLFEVWNLREESWRKDTGTEEKKDFSWAKASLDEDDPSTWF